MLVSESILTLAGYLVWRGELRWPIVIAVGVASASIGDNIGYWFGRRTGASAIHRYGRRLGITAAQFEKGEAFIVRHGALGVYLTRFLPGVRFAAGPAAGLAGLAPRRFFVANLLGASSYVPIVVAVGYTIGDGFGAYLERFRFVVAAVEHIVLAGAALTTVMFLGRRFHLRSLSKGSRQAPRLPPN